METFNTCLWASEASLTSWYMSLCILSNIRFSSLVKRSFAERLKNQTNIFIIDLLINVNLDWAFQNRFLGQESVNMPEYLAIKVMSENGIRKLTHLCPLGTP